MAFVIKMAIQTKTVKLVFRIRLIQFLQKLQFLQPSFVPVKAAYKILKPAKCLVLHHVVIPDDLDHAVEVAARHIANPDHVAEHALAREAKHFIAAIKRLANAHSCDVTTLIRRNNTM